MNRVTDFLPAEYTTTESSENLSLTSDCLEAQFAFEWLEIALCLLFREKDSVIDAYWFLFHSGDSPKPVSINNKF